VKLRIAVFVAGWTLSACGGKTVTEQTGAGSGGATSGSGPTAGGGPTTTSSQSVGIGAGGGGSVAVGAGGSVGVGGGFAGSPGSGGTPRPGGVTYCSPPYSSPMPIVNPLISDFEGNLFVQSIMPSGLWGVDSDGLGSYSMTLEPCGTNGKGLHFTGQGHAAWGAEVAAAMVSQTQPVDVTPYGGLRFVVRSITSVPLIFKVQNPYSQPPCGKCDDTITGAECYSGYIRLVPLPPGIPMPVVVRWTDLTQQVWGYKAPGTAQFDPTNLVSIALAFDKNVDFDVCIDDMMFIP
jgi:hypothetical protein